MEETGVRLPEAFDGFLSCAVAYSYDFDVSVVQIGEGTFKPLPFRLHKMRSAEHRVNRPLQPVPCSVEHILHSRVGTAQQYDKPMRRIDGKEYFIVEPVRFESVVPPKKKTRIDDLVVVEPRKIREDIDARKYLFSRFRGEGVADAPFGEKTLVEVITQKIVGGSPDGVFVLEKTLSYTQLEIRSVIAKTTETAGVVVMTVAEDDEIRCPASKRRECPSFCTWKEIPCSDQSP